MVKSSSSSLFFSGILFLFFTACGQKYSIGVGAVPLATKEDVGENQAPTLSVLPSENATVQTSKTFTFMLLGKDPEGSTLHYTLKGSQIESFEINNISSRSTDRFLEFKGSPTAGTFNVTAEVCDSAEVAKCASKNISVNVSTAPSNVQPVLLVAEPTRNVADGSQNNPFSFFAYDPDGDNFDIRVVDSSTGANSIGQTWSINATKDAALLNVRSNVSGTVNAVLSAKDSLNPATEVTLTGIVINNFCNINPTRYLTITDFTDGTNSNGNTIVHNQSNYNAANPYPDNPNLKLELSNTGACDVAIRIGLPPRSSINLIVDPLATAEDAGKTEFEYASFNISNVTQNTIGGITVYNLKAGQKSVFTLLATNKRKVHSRTNLTAPGADILWFYYAAKDPTPTSTPMIPKPFNVHVK